MSNRSVDVSRLQKEREERRRQARSWKEYWFDFFNGPISFEEFFKDVELPPFTQKPDDPMYSPHNMLWELKVTKRR